MAKRKNIQNNYVKLGMILFAVILITLIASNLYTNAVKRNIDVGHLSSRVWTIEYDEISDVLVELSGDTFLYISYTGDRDIYNLDVSLRRMINRYDLREQFIYLDMIEQMENNNFLEDLNETLSLDEMRIRALPAILYYQDNQLVEIIDSHNQLLRASDFSHLLEKFEIIRR